MRFPEFSGEWEKCKVSDILDLYPTNSLSWEQLEYKYEGLYNLHYGLIHNCSSICINTRKIKLPTIKENNIPNNYTSCKNGDVAFADASEDTNDVARCIEFINCNNDNVVCGLHTVHGRDNSEKTIVGFKGYAFSAQSFRHQIRRLAQGTKIYSINSKNFSECYIGIPSKEEQTKVSNLLYIIDERIQTQKKIIEDLKKLKKEISKRIFSKQINFSKQKFLGDICTITTGKLDANAMTKNGKYLFFTCAYENYKTDTYAFEGKALLISGNGEVGLVKKYNGKFNAYQRTYVLQNFIENMDYIKCYIEYFLPKRIQKEKNVGAMPYIVLSTLYDMNIAIPSIETQNQISKIIDTIINFIECEYDIQAKYELQKQFLLRRMFI